MAASSAMVIACLSGCDLISIWVVVWVCGLTIDSPSARLCDFCDPFVCMKPYGFYVAWKGRIESLLGCWVESVMPGYGYV